MAAYSRTRVAEHDPHAGTSSPAPCRALQAVWNDYDVARPGARTRTPTSFTPRLIYFIDPSGKERFAASPMVDHTTNGTSYLPLAQQAAWGRGIALIARQLAR